MDSTTGAPRDNQQQLEQNRQMLGKVARTMYTQSIALNEKVRTLSILQAIDDITLESKRNMHELGRDISSAITASSKFSMVSIFSIDTIEAEYLRFQGWGLSRQLIERLTNQEILGLLTEAHIALTSEWVASRLRHLITALDRHDKLASMGLPEQHTEKIYRILHDEFGLNSLYMTKMIVNNTVVGLMVVGLEESAPHIDDIELIERIANTTGIALYNRLLFEENLRNVTRLTESNQKLKAIDATKDEFIALASHQLRTPLTSMKGYVSMLLDGDYGEVTERQRDALQRAYDSAQRMVYLVADLLNVSRLQTGKFVISNSPTDLTQIVKEEFNQLTETAKGKRIDMHLNIKGDIPKLLIDAMKMRQVIMNFIDNALYYTPTGGKVTVELALSTDFVTFTVTDTGVGIPKAEQTNLFKKFFRASNARRARPDGTGLGLFMAAKVINAQGGQILFISKEGVGSTFGFRLPRSPA